ncbi:hypothetical protein OSB04_027194 [Centaurea solstitialis]|uniref:Uncharacterized protein n=1 Tax=Centaurea solstitialis TaxID=347529 RepID=A0AA38SE59_9ASTR|nr:hypothetical protein OSB04_027194 [Centaurea solstitialis]
MGFLKDERSKRALRGFKTIFFLVTMIISFYSFRLRYCLRSRMLCFRQLFYRLRYRRRRILRFPIRRGSLSFKRCIRI